MKLKGKSYLTASIITAVIFAIYYYIALPAFNIHAGSFWVSILIALAIFVVSSFLANAFFAAMEKMDVVVVNKGAMICGAIAIAVVLILIIGGLSSSTLFNAKRYSSLIVLNEADFKTDMPETTEVTNIALMDTDSAKVLGNRTLGSLSDMVSQYEISDTYTQINYKGSPQKVANLEYNGIFKWLNNKKDGVPGYIMVDPVKNTSKFIKLDKGFKYVDSAFFNEDLDRKLRFSYPTKIFGDKYFEVDEDGNPFYIVSCLAPNAGLFGAMDVSEVIIFNPIDGTSDICNVKDVPRWVDIVYTGDLASNKYNWYGTLSGGFWNSVIGQKGCNQTTDDYGYIMMDDDVWYYTGVTSVLADESNIGFILTNARTGEYKYYSIYGAEEYSAMSAAEGEVQEKAYTASFPSLINVADQASYIMVLKDNSGIVKLYALVNVENYSFVATGETQAKAIAAYKQLLIDNQIIPATTEIIEVDEEDDGEQAPEIEWKDAPIIVADVRIATVNGESYIYITDTEGVVTKKAIADDEAVMTIQPGMALNIKYTTTDVSGIYLMGEWSKQ